MRNTGTGKCLNGRSAPGTGTEIYYCAIEGFVVRIAEGPRRVDNLDWYNAEGIGWMAASDANGTQLLVPVGAQPAPSFGSAGCYVLNLTTTTTGAYGAPSRLEFGVPEGSGAAVTSLDGKVAGWLYGATLYLKYSEPVGGRTGTGTIRADLTGDGNISGNFVATSFGSGFGAEGTVSGTKSARCPG